MATQVFISWSGELSRKLAEAVRGWLPAALQFVKPYFSPRDIEKGTKWASMISTELSKSQVGIICLTRDNLDSPWILFEAGALSNNLERSRACTLLFGLEPAEVTEPLAVFQATRFTKEDFKSLTETINNASGDSKLEKSVLDSVFEKWWPELKEQVDKILAEHKPAAQDKSRPVPDMVREILELTRLHVQREADEGFWDASHSYADPFTYGSGFRTPDPWRYTGERRRRYIPTAELQKEAQQSSSSTSSSSSQEPHLHSEQDLGDQEG
jgi:hypothetical protein